MELDELFDGNRVRDASLGLAKTVIREHDLNPVRMDYPEIHPKIWGMRYTLDAGYADYVIPNYGLPMMVFVSGEPMKQRMLELVREIAILVHYPAPDHWIDIVDDGMLWLKYDAEINNFPDKDGKSR